MSFAAGSSSRLMAQIGGKGETGCRFPQPLDPRITAK
jgi:hypothetical protein